MSEADRLTAIDVLIAPDDDAIPRAHYQRPVTEERSGWLATRRNSCAAHHNLAEVRAH